MKSNLKLFGIIALAVMIVFTASCTGPEGPMGPEGPEGPRGGSGSGGSGGSDGQDGQDGINGSDLTFYTITYNTGEGGSDMSTVKIAEGSTAHRPDNVPTRVFADIESLGAGLYRAGVGGWIFVDWYLDGVRYNFDSPVTSNLTLTASWLSPGKATDEEIGKAITDTGYIEAVCEFISKEPRGYLLLVDRDYTVTGTTGQKLDGSNILLTIMGMGAERTITSNTTDGLLFEINNEAGLTLGANITLHGKQTATNSLLTILEKSKLIMEDGSKITGHKTSGSTTVYHRAGSIFTMNGGEISGNETTTTATNVAGGVVMGLNTEFIMNGGKISGNTGSSTSDFVVGGVSIVEGARFTMNDGEISGNTANTGGVYFSGGNLITMNGGKISGNIGTSVGGVSVSIANGYSFTMTGGEISGNTTTGGMTGTGGLRVNNFTMTGGEIKGNTGARAGLYIMQGIATISGGKITGNTGIAVTNSIGVLNTGVLTMTGGEISDNTGTIGNMHTETRFIFSGGSITAAGGRGTVSVGTANDASITLAGSVSLDTIGCANNSINPSPIYIASGWSGSVTNLNLYSNSSSVTDVANAWVNQQVMLGQSPYTLTATDIAKFTNVFFLTNDGFKQNVAVNTGSGTYRISTVPSSLGKLLKN